MPVQDDMYIEQLAEDLLKRAHEPAQRATLTTFCIQSIMAFKPRFVFSKKAGTEPVKAETLRTKAQVALKEPGLVWV